jgi:hydrogenase maturation protease
MPKDKQARVLIGGLGNIFLGDDAFGVEVVRRLSEMPLPDDVRLMDVGVRTLHLAYELREHAYDTLIIIDIVSKGADPGTLYLLEPDSDEAFDDVRVQNGHGVHPHEILAVVRQLGGEVPRMVIVACEPSPIGADAGLSAAVSAAVDKAAQLVMRVIHSRIASMALPN